MESSKRPNVELHFDDEAYGKVAGGFVAKVLRSLIRTLADRGLIDLKTDLTADEEELIFDLAFGFLVQLEEFEGHEYGAHRYPAAVGFTVNTLDRKPAHNPERLLSTQKRTFLHGAVETDVIRTVFEGLRAARRSPGYEIR